MKRKTPRPGANYRASVELFRISEALWEASRAYLARWDLSPSQFNILNLLHGEPEGCTQAELGRDLIMHRSNVTGLLDRLAARGLVQRRDLPNDRRAFNVVLTEAGELLIRQIQPDYYKSLEKMWGGMEEEEAKALILKLQRIAANANEVAHAAAQNSRPSMGSERGSHDNKNSRRTHSRTDNEGAASQRED